MWDKLVFFFNQLQGYKYPLPFHSSSQLTFQVYLACFFLKCHFKHQQNVYIIRYVYIIENEHNYMGISPTKSLKLTIYNTIAWWNMLRWYELALILMAFTFWVNDANSIGMWSKVVTMVKNIVWSFHSFKKE